MKHVTEYEKTKWLTRILLKDTQIQALGKQTKMFKNKFLTVVTSDRVFWTKEVHIIVEGKINYYIKLP